MKENIEEDIKIFEEKLKEYHTNIFDDRFLILYEKDIETIENVLSEYKRPQKENLRLRYQDIPYLEGEIKGYKTRIEELKKEKEELAQRCRNLDQEAQGYLEALVGDNTLTKRNIKQLQEENKELREQNKYEWIRQHCLPQGLINKYYIPKQKIKDKIEELKQYKGLVIYERCNYEATIQVLQKLLEEE